MLTTDRGSGLMRWSVEEEPGLCVCRFPGAWEEDRLMTMLTASCLGNELRKTLLAGVAALSRRGRLCGGWSVGSGENLGTAPCDEAVSGVSWTLSHARTSPTGGSGWHCVRYPASERCGRMGSDHTPATRLQPAFQLPMSWGEYLFSTCPHLACTQDRYGLCYLLWTAALATQGANS